MTRYNFIKYDGHLYRLTKSAYQAWIRDSAARLLIKKSAAKLTKYGTDLGLINDIRSITEFSMDDFIKLGKSYSIDNK